MGGRADLRHARGEYIHRTVDGVQGDEDFAAAKQQMLRNPVAGSACGVPESEGTRKLWEGLGVAGDVLRMPKAKHARTHSQ